MLFIGICCLTGILFTAPAFPQSFVAPIMVSVEGGSFQMGSAKGNLDEQPVHKVTLNSFWIGKYEVTNGEFKKFVDATGYLTDAEQTDTYRTQHGIPPRNANNGNWRKYLSGSKLSEADSNKPVQNVSWNDAVAYCGWLSKMTGKNFRLPTEAEWEYAARGGSKSKGYKYIGGNVLDQVAWYRSNSDQKVHAGGLKSPNELGLYDMAGNVREWCGDFYGPYYYKESPEENPAGPPAGTNRVMRGGSFANSENFLRATYRNGELPYNSAPGIGFRLLIPGEPVAKAVPPPPVEKGPMDDLETKGFLDIYGIYFDPGKADIKPESIPVIDQLVGYMNNHPQIRITVEGHTDNTGDPKKNQTLSEKRAESIKAEMVKHGIDASRIETKGFGDTKPVADNKTKAGRTQNRRVTVRKINPVTP